MALYFDQAAVKKAKPANLWDQQWKPGEKPKYPGIYKCQRCKFEDVFNRECETVPPCSQCAEETTTWKLLVIARDGSD